MSLIVAYEDEISTIPYEPGQQVFCTDSSNIYIDIPGNKRVHLNQVIIDKDNKQEIESIIAPLTDKIYRACDTGLLYTFYGGNLHNVGGFEEITKAFQIMDNKVTKLELGMKTNLLDRLKMVKIEAQLGNIPLINNREYKVTVWGDTSFILPTFAINGAGQIILHVNLNNGIIDIGTRHFNKRSENIPDRGIFDIEYRYNPHYKSWVADISVFEVR